MTYTTVRISNAARETLRELARAEGRPMQALLEQAVEALRRKHFLDEVNLAYASLRSDAKAWAAIEEERREWDGTLLDGIAVHERGRRYRAGAGKQRRRRQKLT